MNSETRVCQNCKNQFVIEPDDFNFYPPSLRRSPEERRRASLPSAVETMEGKEAAARQARKS